MSFKPVLVYLAIQLFTTIILGAELKKKFDYIVIGSGPGGSPVAARLALENYEVLVIEAGPNDLEYSSNQAGVLTPNYAFPEQTTMLDNAAFFMFARPDINWGASHEPSFWKNGQLTDRIEGASRAKILGGCSSHNLLVWNRGASEDFDYVKHAYGLDKWGFNEMLPYFMKSETYLGPNKTNRGINGPVTVMQRNIRSWNEKNVKLIDACKSYGLEDNDNFQAGSQSGVGVIDVAHFQCSDNPGYCNGIAFNSKFKRQSAAEAYLRKLITENNKESKLTIYTDSIAKRILFDADKNANAVEYYDKAGKLQTVFLKNKGEIIIAAGTYQSPQILMLSGVGPLSEISKYNDIEIVHISPNVGQNYSNHLYLAMQFEINNDLLLNSQTQPNSYSFFPGVNNDTMPVFEFFLKSGTYILDGVNDISDNGIFNNYNDIRIECWAEGINFAPINTGVTPIKSIVCYIDPQIYSQAGRISLKSSDIHDFPLLFGNFFYDERDFRGYYWAVKELRKIFAEDQYSFISEKFPGAQYTTYDDIKDIVLNYSVDSAHPHGTLSMGISSLDAVDNECRVNGVNNVRVSDASIWPKPTNANPTALIYGIAERCAQFTINERKSKDDHYAARISILPSIDKDKDKNTNTKQTYKYNKINTILLGIVIILLFMLMSVILCSGFVVKSKPKYQKVSTYGTSSDINETDIASGQEF